MKTFGEISMSGQETSVTFATNHDVSITPISAVPEWVLAKLDSREGDFVISRPYGRGSSILVNSLGVQVVEAFRQSCSIPDALRSVCEQQGVAAEGLVRAVYPLLEKLIEQNFLVKEEELRDLSQSLSTKSYNVGEFFREYLILAKVQQYDDSAVFKVQLPDGAYGALKVLRLGTGELIDNFKREHAILVQLDGGVSPKVIDAEVESGDLFILTEWIEGCSIVDWCNSLVNLPHARRFAELKEIVLKTLSAYHTLHSLGVIHSDIWAKNIIVDQQKRVRLIDFGLSRHASTDRLFGIPPRGNAEFYKAPDLASAQLNKVTPQAATVESDIYSLGVLLYLLVVGKFYVEFSLGKDEQNRQVCEDRMIPFEERGAIPWPEMEALLSEMLSKDASQRIASLELCVSKVKHMPEPSEIIEDGSPTGEVDPIPFIRSYVGESFSTPLLAPTASLFMGVGGLAYCFLRSALLLKDHGLLREAEFTTCLARAWMEAGPEGSINPTTFIDRNEVGAHTLFHHAEGIAMLEALVAHATQDHASLKKACLRFIDGAQARPEAAEYMTGKAGILNALRQLTYLVVENEELVVLGNELAEKIVEELESFPSVSQSSIRFIGFAHGWAGILHTLLAWGRDYNRGIIDRVFPFLQQLNGMRVQTMRGSYWPRHLDEPVSAGDFPSWCSGTAGQILLWLEAFKATNDSAWLTNAIEAGTHVVHTGNSEFDLCCGSTGGALCLAHLYACTGNSEWLQSAEKLLSKSQAYATAYIHSLFKGIPGMEVSRLELRSPGSIAFPTVASDAYGPALSVGALVRN